MPRSDAPRDTASRRATSIFISSSQRIAAPKLPTPGSTIFDARAIASASRVTCSAAATSRNARAMFAAFENGESISVIR